MTSLADDLLPAYWTFGVGSGAHVLVSGLLEMVREDAESSAPP